MRKQPAPTGIAGLLAHARVGVLVFSQVYETCGDARAAALVTLTVLAGPRAGRAIERWQSGSTPD